MRFFSAFALASLVLAGCSASGAGSANGWAAAPRAQADRPARGAIRVAERRPERARPAARPTASGVAPGLSAGAMIPVEGIDVSRLSDSFTSPRSGGRTHNAIDIAAPTGTPVLAITDGRVSRKHWNRLGGRTLYLTSADGQHDFYYAHLDAYEDDIEVGSVVQRGDVLGTVGSTGNARGPHLHFQILRKGSGRGTPVNPYEVLTESLLYR